MSSDFSIKKVAMEKKKVTNEIIKDTRRNSNGDEKSHNGVQRKTQRGK
jgi:hypothetical protein